MTNKWFNNIAIWDKVLTDDEIKMPSQARFMPPKPIWIALKRTLKIIAIVAVVIFVYWLVTKF